MQYILFALSLLACSSTIPNISVDTDNIKVEYMFDESEEESFSIRRTREWIFPPKIFICPDAPYTLEEVEVAVKLYTDMGHEIREIIHLEDCNIKPQDFGIFIRKCPKSLWKKNPWTIGLTAYKNVSGFYGRAEINIIHKKDMLLEHELGHALGYKHNEVDSEHIMYPKYKKGWKKTYGLTP